MRVQRKALAVDRGGEQRAAARHALQTPRLDEQAAAQLQAALGRSREVLGFRVRPMSRARSGAGAGGSTDGVWRRWACVPHGWQPLRRRCAGCELALRSQRVGRRASLHGEQHHGASSGAKQSGT